MDKITLIKNLIDNLSDINKVESILDTEMENYAYELLNENSEGGCLNFEEAQELWIHHNIFDYLSEYRQACIHDAYLDEIYDYALDNMG